MAHTGRPGDIPSVCIGPAFLSGRAIWRIMAFIVHMSVPTHITAPCSVSLWCLPSLFFSSQMEKQHNVRPPLGTTEWNHSYFTGNPLSALHSLQQLQAGASSPSSVQIVASTRVSHGAATSSSVCCPQVTLSAAHPQVQTGPTRTVTSDLLSATLAEAATQLFFAAFLERCISVSASPPPPLPIPTPLLDAATQTIPHIAVSLDVSTQLSLEEFSLRCAHPHNPSEALAPPPTHEVLSPTCSRPVPSLLRCSYAVFPTQCRISRFLHTTTADGVLHRVHLLQRPFGPPRLVFGTLHYWQRLTATTC